METAGPPGYNVGEAVSFLLVVPDPKTRARSWLCRGWGIVASVIVCNFQDGESPTVTGYDVCCTRDTLPPAPGIEQLPVYQARDSHLGIRIQNRTSWSAA